MARLRHLIARVRGERGAELIEMALVLPLLLLLIGAVVDFGLMFREFQIVTNAAREGARAAILPGYTNQDVRERVEDYMQASSAASSCVLGGTPTTTVCSVTVTTDTLTTTGPPVRSFQARNVTVTLRHDFPYLTPLVAWTGGTFNAVTLTGRAVMRAEVQAAGL